MIDLYKNQYDEKTLKDHLFSISLIDLLKTQKISSDFAFTYLLNKDFQITKEEEDLTVNDILFYQPHLKESNLLDLVRMGIRRKGSFEDFQTFSEKN